MLREHQKEYYENNKEKIRESQKRYRENNKEKIKKYQDTTPINVTNDIDIVIYKNQFIGGD